MTDTGPPRIVRLVVRFSNSLPDLPLELSELAFVVTVKDEIRKTYPSLETLNLHLIYSGQILSADKTLGELIKRKPEQDGRGGLSQERKSQGWKGKGRATDADLAAQALEDAEREQLLRQQHEQQLETIYLHCAPGGPRANAGTEDKIAAAVRQFEERVRRESVGEGANEQPARQAQDEGQTSPSPRGFDRLLSAGLSATEISQLRSEFEALHDTTGLSVTEQRALEDAWIDEGAGSELADGSPRGVHEEMAIGLVCGFFFPVLLLVSAKERWSKRRWAAVAMGVLANLIFGGGRWVG